MPPGGPLRIIPDALNEGLPLRSMVFRRREQAISGSLQRFSEMSEIVARNLRISSVVDEPSLVTCRFQMSVSDLALPVEG
jgi:hypothetical protein